MKRARLWRLAVVVAVLLIGQVTPVQAQGAIAPAAECQFILGFATLKALIDAAEGPEKVGDCLENERFNPQNGEARQHTTSGLLVWRKADNWTAFTDGYRTWANGPHGLQSRLNTEGVPVGTAGADHAVLDRRGHSERCGHGENPAGEPGRHAGGRRGDRPAQSRQPGAGCGGGQAVLGRYGQDPAGEPGWLAGRRRGDPGHRQPARPRGPRAGAALAAWSAAGWPAAVSRRGGRGQSIAAGSPRT